MNRERRLGRGLEALLSQGGQDASEGQLEHEAHAATQPGESLLKLNVYEIDTNPYQPRTEFDADEIANLAESIKQHGLLQPIVVRRSGERYQLIAGERRWRASIQAGLSELSATVQEVDDRQVAEITIVENLQRKDLGPLEKAASFQRYLEQYQTTQEELAGRLSIDRSTIANLIRLLELPDGVQQALREQKITAGHARALLPLGEEHQQVAVCEKIQRDQLSVRATEQLVSETNRAEDRPFGVVGADDPAPRSPRDSQLASLEQEFRAALGTKVDVRQSATGKGRITIHFKNHEEFDRVRELLSGPSHPQQHYG
ncbi:MAG: ParB/RepB/Spo0J family partition protein [Planctomycetota bacterium]|nr:MAG: ParB/RepB/Spo0J family partition protein [Planctomycetota bacterium]REJ90326.1 MAG: ParB/RepB/Spo0J family partition protein [Planctomycetota bacterium]